LNAEQLISMASARGIDFVAAAQQSTDLPRRDTVSRTRLGVRITQLQEQPEMRAYGRETRSMVEPEWSSADAGFVLAGLDKVCGSPAPALAALYAWAGHRQYYWPLVTELRTVAMRLRRREHWAELIENHRGQPVDYIERLCEMALFDDEHPTMLDYAPEASVGQDHQGGILRAIYCDVALPVWKRNLADRYTRIWGVWVGWLDTAARYAQSRLREDEMD
jgi:hypothetical protein